MSSPGIRSKEEWLTPKEVAAIIRCHHYKVLTMIGGDTPAFPNAINTGSVGHGKRYLVPRSDVDRYLTSRRVAA